MSSLVTCSVDVVLFDSQEVRNRLRELQAIARTDCVPNYNFLGGVRIFGCLEAQRIIAFGGLTHRDGDWVLGRCVVHPDHRGRGLQKRLISARLDNAMSLGAKEVIVWVEPGNLFSINNLVESGFVWRDVPIYQLYGRPHISLVYNVPNP